MNKNTLLGIGAVVVLGVIVAKAMKNAEFGLTKEAKARPITLEKKAEI
jgi:hypothetical protein